MSRITERFAEAKKKNAEALDKAEREAIASGKELFDLAKFEWVLNRGPQAINEPAHRWNYYIHHAELGTLVEYAAYLHENDEHFWSSAPLRSPVVEATAPATDPAWVSPGTAFAIAYLPARRVAHGARLELIAGNAATIDGALAQAIAFSRRALKIEDSIVGATDAHLAKLATSAGITLPPVPAPAAVAAWLGTLLDLVKPHLTSPVLEAAWKAGEAGRLLAISAQVAAHIAYLRCSSPENADLRAQAGERARDLKASAAALTAQLEAAGLPLVISDAPDVERLITLTSNLEPTTAEGYRQLNELVTKIDDFLEGTVRHLDAVPPPKASSPPTAEEQALLQRIVADPSDYALRFELGRLADKRNDPRAQLIDLQTVHKSSAAKQRADDLVHSHPDWTARLRELGARDIEFAGGFPEVITIDAEVLLARWNDLRAAAPLRCLHVRGASGRVGEVVRSANLATIQHLDLDSQGVTDEDVEALSANPAAGRLRRLDLRSNPLSARGIEAIAASPILRGLEVVSLEPNPADPVDRWDEMRYVWMPTDAGAALEAKYGPLRWLRGS